jgi:hypothetical protein
MNPWIKSRWVGALRSGDFAQTTGVLQRTVTSGDRPAGYCCLGVLCELAVADGVIEKQVPQNNGDSYTQRAVFGDDTKTLPLAVQRWAGIDNSDPTVKEEATSLNHSLSHWNDTSKYNFAQIADLIEAGL